MRSLGTRLPQTYLPVVSQMDSVLRYSVADVVPLYCGCSIFGGSKLELFLTGNRRSKLVPHEALSKSSAGSEQTFIRKYQLSRQTRFNIALPRTRTSDSWTNRALRC